MRVGMLIISKKALGINDIITSMEAIRDENFHHIDMYQIKLGETQSQAPFQKTALQTAFIDTVYVYSYTY